MFSDICTIIESVAVLAFLPKQFATRWRLHVFEMALVSITLTNVIAFTCLITFPPVGDY